MRRKVRQSSERQRRVLATVERMERLQAQLPALTDEVCDELISAVQRKASFNSAHEGWAVIKEELDELWDEVRKSHQDTERMRAEVVRVAAMAMRFAVDVCGKVAV